MKKLTVLLCATSLGFACAPNIKKEERPVVVTARFDPSQSPAVVPSPNDLATDPATGLLNVPLPEGASDADKAFVEYLNSLNGFPSSSFATATFDGPLSADTVKPSAVRLFDADQNLKEILSAPTYADITLKSEAGEDVPAGQVEVAPPAGGFQAGHSYVVAVLGGDNGLKGADGATPVVGSATWAFIRSEKSLVTCTDLTSPDCQTATGAIPSSETDPAKRLADQTAKAIQLEQLRLHYKPAIDHLISLNVARGDIALLWSFKIADQGQIVFNPAATPPAVPTPTDLVKSPTTGLLNVPIDPSTPAANQEFIADYLNTLNGFPVSTPGLAGVTGGQLDPATVNKGTVLVLTLKGAPITNWTPTFDPVTSTISVVPEGGSWGKSKQVAVVVLGGENGVHRTGGGTVVGTEIWALVRSPAPLVDCDDLTSPDCQSNLVVAPLSTSQAIQLEGLRRAYAPILDSLEALPTPITRDMVAVLWVWSTVDLPEATFDPANGVIPFPNDVVRTGAGGRLSLPIDPMAPASLQQLLGGLNTLDGFSLTAPIVSENSDTLGVIDATLDTATADGGVGFMQLAGVMTPPADVKVCFNCASSLLPDGGVPVAPQQLQFVPNRPLTEQGTYGAWMTTDLADTDGRKVMASPTFALARLKNPLCSEVVSGACTTSAKSTVSGVTDAQAAQLEPLRLGLKPFLDGLEAQGLPRSKLALAWAFRAQTVVTALKGVHDAIAAGSSMIDNGAGLSANPTAVYDATAPTLAAMGPLPKANIAKIYNGNLELPYLLTGTDGAGNPTGTFNPNVMKWGKRKAPFLLTIPTGTVPSAGWPVLVFGHGLSGNRTQALAFANTAATAGYAMLAIDVVLHGERMTCVGVGAALQSGITGTPVPGATDDYACANPATMRCEPLTGRCVARTNGTACVADLQCIGTGKGAQCQTVGAGAGFCEEADFQRNASGQPALASWNYLNLANLFATRDDFRHPVADFTQLTRVIKATGAGSLSTLLGADGPLNGGAPIQYAGISLGGFNGSLVSSVAPEFERFALNVPGSDLVQVLLTSPAFGAQRTGFLGGLAQLGVTPGTPAFDNFMVLARTVLDPCDPQNVIHNSVNIASPATRKIYIQYIQADFVVPNPTTQQLITAATQGAKQPYVRQYTLAEYDFTALAPADRHGFLLNFKNPAATASAQGKVMSFIATGSDPQ